jgi:hypothetical protein
MMVRLSHALVGVLLLALIPWSPSAVALLSPAPGHLTVANSLASDGSGGCTGSLSMQYGMKATDIASGWTFDLDSENVAVSVFDARRVVH